jgi:predicted transcriptional regulator
VTEAFDLQVGSWLEEIGISQLSEWDVLIFLCRHGTSLASAGQIALLLGYSKSIVGKSLDRLGALGLVQRSRSSQGVRLYHFAIPVNSTHARNVEELLKVSEKRSGRLVVARSLKKRERPMEGPPRAGLHLA